MEFHTRWLVPRCPGAGARLSDTGHRWGPNISGQEASSCPALLRCALRSGLASMQVQTGLSDLDLSEMPVYNTASSRQIVLAKPACRYSL